MSLLSFLGPVGAVLGGIAGLKSSSAANKAAGAQNRLANQQQQLFNYTTPSYLDSLNALRSLAGFQPLDYTHTTTTQQPDNNNFLARLGINHSVTSSTPTPITNGTGIFGPTPNPYNRNDLGIFGTPQASLQFQQFEDQANRSANQAADRSSFALGRRGLANSSLDASARAAILADAERNKANFGRQLAINAPHEQAARVAQLLAALNPGLGAGSIAGSIFGNQQAINTQAAGQAGANVGGILQNYALLDALKNGQSQAPTTSYGTNYQFTPGIAGFTQPGGGYFPTIDLNGGGFGNIGVSGYPLNPYLAYLQGH